MTLIWICLLIGLGGAAYVRLAPADLARWHGDISSDIPANVGPCIDQITTTIGSARAVCQTLDSAITVLTKLDAIAVATPRTTRLAGDPASGRITWVTRSALWGFPDYTTAQTTETPQGSRLEIYARLRFGQSDFGVNAARLREWLTQL